MPAARRWTLTLVFLLSFSVLGVFLSSSFSYAVSDTLSQYHFNGYNEFFDTPTTISETGSDPTSVNVTKLFIEPDLGTIFATANVEADTAFGSNKAYADVTNLFSASFSDSRASAFARSLWEDTWTITGGTGTGTLTGVITLTGSITGTGQLMSYTLLVPTSGASLFVDQTAFSSGMNYPVSIPFEYGVPLDVISELTLTAMGSTFASDYNPDGGVLDFLGTALLSQIILPEGATLRTESGATYPTSTVPLPPSVLLLGSGLLGLGAVGWRRKLS